MYIILYYTAMYNSMWKLLSEHLAKQIITVVLFVPSGKLRSNTCRTVQ